MLLKKEIKMLFQTHNLLEVHFYLKGLGRIYISSTLFYSVPDLKSILNVQMTDIRIQEHGIKRNGKNIFLIKAEILQSNLR